MKPEGLPPDICDLVGIALQKHQRGPIIFRIGVMKPDPIYRQKFAFGRIFFFSTASGLPDEKGGACGRACKKERGLQS